MLLMMYSDLPDREINTILIFYVNLQLNYRFGKKRGFKSNIQAGMQIRSKIVQSFFRNTISLIRSEYFSDALRTTLSIILPFALFYSFVNPHTAIAVGVGALLISLTDSPGTLKDKMIMSVSSLVVFFLISLVTAFLIKSILFTGLLILILCMVFSLFMALGKRYGLLGTMALILMTFVQGLRPEEPLMFSCYIVLGGIWYYVVSLIQARLWRISSVRHALGECILSTSVFLRAKSAFYRSDTEMEDNYLRIIRLHNKVSERQEQVRDLLLRDERLMMEDHLQGQRYLLATSQVIDLYELISAIQYDYESLQEVLKVTGLLEAVASTIESLANDLQSLGLSLRAQARVKFVDTAAEKISFVRERISMMEAGEQAAYLSILLKLQDNIDDIYHGLRKLRSTLVDKAEMLDFSAEIPAYQFFTDDERIGFGILLRQLNFRAPVFRFALRLSLACLVAYSFTLLPVGFYSYWILLTVIVVIKPSFGLTKKRNLQRLKGTLGGVLIGVILLSLVSNVTILLVLSALFLFGYFAYLRLNYALSILYLTPMVIICLNLYEQNDSIVIQRTFDTLLGCAIAFAASYLFPSWEIKKHSVYIRDVISANLKYLMKLHEQAMGIPLDMTSFKLARKEVYTKLAALSSGVQNMLLEPRKARGEVQHLYEFQILSHQLSSTIASFFPFSSSEDHLVRIKDKIAEAVDILAYSLEVLENTSLMPVMKTTIESDDLPDVSQPGHLEEHKIQQILRISEAVREQAYHLR